MQVLKNRIEEGLLPPAPDLAGCERLAKDLEEVFVRSDADAALRVADYYQIEAQTWKTGNLSLEDAVRRAIGERLGRGPDTDASTEAFTPADARMLVACWEGFLGRSGRAVGELNS